VEAVYEIGDGSYITAWWYYDGGSDGEEEYEQYESKLNAYFARRA
jgi:hypothetical protein